MNTLNDFPFSKFVKIGRRGIRTKFVRKHTNALETNIIRKLDNSDYSYLVPKVSKLDENTIWMKNVTWTLGTFLLLIPQHKRYDILMYVVKRLFSVFELFKSIGFVHLDLFSIGGILRNVLVDKDTNKFFIIDFDHVACVDEDYFEEEFERGIGALTKITNMNPSRLLISSITSGGSLNNIVFCDSLS